MLSKEVFIGQIWAKINNHSVEAMDAVIDTAESNNLDMETAAKIVGRDAKLKALIEQQARKHNNLK